MESQILQAPLERVASKVQNSQWTKMLHYKGFRRMDIKGELVVFSVQCSCIAATFFS